MRMMMRYTLPVDRGTEAIHNGAMTGIIQGLMEKLKPEAAYFWPENGKRSGLMVFEMTDSAQIPLIAEPLFSGASAAVEFTPVMNSDDLMRALAQLSA
jgi:hypothetical protein